MRFLAAFVTSLALSAQAATITTDFSDLWFNTNEEGWGVNIIQQNNILFITFFVYASNGQPVWYVGPATAYTSTTSDGIVSFAGPLYTTTGPYFGAATFNESQVIPRQVGTVAFSAAEISGGAVSYSVDGVTVTKTVRRQTWRAENIGGNYIGGIAGTYQGCGPSRNGNFEGSVTLTVGHDGGSTVSMREDGAGYFCNYNGAYTQEGRMGRIQGTATCSDGNNQSFIATEVQGSPTSLTMRLLSTFTGSCVFNGRIGAARRP